MGSTFANELANTDLGLSFEDAMAIHLRSNHYPPVPYSMVPVCIEAIDAYNEGDRHRNIRLPFDGVDKNGEPFQITWRGQDSAPAWAIIEGHHLFAWIAYDEED